jgi:hypothetical protein
MPSSSRFTQAAPHAVRPGAHGAAAHAPCEQVVAQGVLHAPQWLASVFTSTQTLPQRVSPAPQVNPHTPALQVGAAPGGPPQALPQAPQLATSLLVDTQEPLQFVAPGPQTSVQTPFEQV